MYWLAGPNKRKARVNRPPMPPARPLRRSTMRANLITHLCLDSLAGVVSANSNTLAGELCRDPVHAERERDFAAVVQVVLDQVPDDPGARQMDDGAIPVIGEGLLHVGGTPARHTSGHQMPDMVEGLHELGGGGDGRPQPQCNLVPARDCLQLLPAVLAKEFGEPVPAATHDVHGILADGAHTRPGTPPRLSPCRLRPHHQELGALAIQWRRPLKKAPRPAVRSKLLLERLGERVPLLLIRVDERALGIARLICLDARWLHPAKAQQLL